MTVYDAQYDENTVKFYDKELKEFHSVQLMIQCHRSDLSEVSDGLNKVFLRNNTCLVYDATNIRGTDKGNEYPWYATTSGLMKAKLRMNTEWNPAFSWVCKGELQITSMSDNTNVIIVPDLATSLEVKRRFKNRVVVPLLETITHIFPIHTGRTLQRIAIHLFNKFDEEWMEEINKVMSVLFERFKGKLNELSSCEGKSIGELYRCSFENTFKAVVEKRETPYIPISFYSTEPGRDVYLTSRSSLISKDDYGDIQWSLASDKERETVSVKHQNGKLVILPENTRLPIKADYITYNRIVIFPQMEFAQGIHEAGSMIGLLLNGQLDFRGSLFDDISEREEIIIGKLFEEFINRCLTDKFNPIEMYGASRLRGKCRPDLIDKVKRIFIKYLQ